jgi:hypothetical protein
MRHTTCRPVTDFGAFVSRDGTESITETDKHRRRLRPGMLGTDSVSVSSLAESPFTPLRQYYQVKVNLEPV